MFTDLPNLEKDNLTCSGKRKQPLNYVNANQNNNNEKKI